MRNQNNLIEKIKDRVTIYNLLPEVDRSKSSIRCPFPDHEDLHPSFSIYDNGMKAKCFSKCGSFDVISFYQHMNGYDFNQAVEILTNIAGITEVNENESARERIVEAIYDYKDTNEKIIFQVIRYSGKQFSQRRPAGNGFCVWNLNGIQPVLYRLSDVVKANTVFIAEGEKDVDNLVDLGVAATTNSMGAGKWRSEYNQFFEDKTVVILPDNDKQGKQHAQNIATSLNGLTESIKIVDLPGLLEKGDVSDWIENQKMKEKDNEIIKMELLDHVKNTSDWKPPAHDTEIISYLESWEHIQNLEINVEWVIDKMIPKESVTVIFGKGGIGKTYLVLDMARCIGSGVPYQGYNTEYSRVIFIDFENPLAVLKDRTSKLGEADGVYFWRSNSEKLKAPKIDSDLWELYKKLPKGSVLIFDTLRASHDKNENSSDEMALVMERFKELRDLGFTVIVLHHTPKNADRIVKGSSVIVDLSDHILGLTRVKVIKGGKEEVLEDDDYDEGGLYRFGFCEKTRFEPHHIYLTFYADRGFELASDPRNEHLQIMYDILVELEKCKKTAFIDICADQMDIGKAKLQKLFKAGEGKLWSVEHRPDKANAKIIHPLNLNS